MSAEKFLENLQVIERTDYTFRVKVPDNNSLITHKVEKMTMWEMMEAYAKEISLKACKEQRTICALEYVEAQEGMEGYDILNAPTPNIDNLINEK